MTKTDELRDDDVEIVARAMAIFSGNDPDKRQLDSPNGLYLWQLHAQMARIAIKAYEAAKLQLVEAPATVNVTESHLIGGKVMDISSNGEIVTIRTSRGPVELAPGEIYTHIEPGMPDLPIVNSNR